VVEGENDLVKCEHEAFKEQITGTYLFQPRHHRQLLENNLYAQTKIGFKVNIHVSKHLLKCIIMKGAISV